MPDHVFEEWLKCTDPACDQWSHLKCIVKTQKMTLNSKERCTLIWVDDKEEYVEDGQTFYYSLWNDGAAKFVDVVPAYWFFAWEARCQIIDPNSKEVATATKSAQSKPNQWVMIAPGCAQSGLRLQDQLTYAAVPTLVQQQ
jgi:hypothetical protein